MFLPATLLTMIEETAMLGAEAVLRVTNHQRRGLMIGAMPTEMGLHEEDDVHVAGIFFNFG
jgi:hypothetical protein